MESIKKILRRFLGLDNIDFEIELELQSNLLEKLKTKTATIVEYKLANNITIARYADYLWPEYSDNAKCHLMFHTPETFNGFRDGEKVKGCVYCESLPSNNLFSYSTTRLAEILSEIASYKY